MMLPIELHFIGGGEVKYFLTDQKCFQAFSLVSWWLVWRKFDVVTVTSPPLIKRSALRYYHTSGAQTNNESHSRL